MLHSYVDLKILCRADPNILYLTLPNCKKEMFFLGEIFVQKTTYLDLKLGCIGVHLGNFETAFKNIKEKIFSWN